MKNHADEKSAVFQQPANAACAQPRPVNETPWLPKKPVPAMEVAWVMTFSLLAAFMLGLMRQNQFQRDGCALPRKGCNLAGTV